MLAKTKLRKLNKPFPSHEYCVRHYRNKLLWMDISNRHDLTYDFIREFKDSIYWNNISSSFNLVLDDQFIEEFKDKLNWHFISSYKKLETKDLRRYKDRLNWGNISRCQKLTDEQIREFDQKMQLERDKMKSNEKMNKENNDVKLQIAKTKSKTTKSK